MIVNTSCFNKSDLADFKIYIGRFELPAHSVVLAVQSDYFRKAIQGQFVEGQNKEIRFEEGSKHAYWRAIEYMYTGSYSNEPAAVLDTKGLCFSVPPRWRLTFYTDDGEFMKDAHVYMIANMFLVEELKHVAYRRFVSKLERLWISETFIDCIEDIYSGTADFDQQIKDAVAKVARDHIGDLWKKKGFQDLVRQIGDFAVDLMGMVIL